MTPPALPPSPPPRSRSSALAVASLILGLSGLIFSPVVLGAALGLAGLVLGVMHLRKFHFARKAAGWGVVLSTLALAAGVTLAAVYYRMARSWLAEWEGGSETMDLTAWEGVLAPDLTVQTLGGDTLRLQDLRGRRVILDFWATWCPPCVKEIPHFVQLSREVPAEELTIVGVSDEDEETLRSFAEQQGVNYAIGLAGDLPSPYADGTAIPTTFFIDRNGVIQSVAVGYHDIDELRDLALGDDYEDEPLPAPGPVVSGLPDASPMLVPVQEWSQSKEVTATCAGDWNGDGQDELLVLGKDLKVRVITRTGDELARISVPEPWTAIEVGIHRDEGARLLGYSNWGREVVVVDRTGNVRWTYPTAQGIDGAHWGDLDGDGTHEMVIGMNGSGGLHAVDSEGKALWHVANLGNVWNQAVVPPLAGDPALVFASEAMGTIRLFDAAGNPLRTLRPNGEYFSQMMAARLDDSGTIQVIAQGDITVGFDPKGRVAWSTPARRDHGAWRGTSFAWGDLDGNGVAEWVFVDRDGTLAVVSSSGLRMSALKPDGPIRGFCVLSATGERGTLAVHTERAVSMFRFE